MRPAMGHPNGTAALSRRFGQTIVTLIAIDLQNAVETAQEGSGILTRASCDVEVDYTRRILAAPRPVIAGQRPQISGLRCPMPRLQHRAVVSSIKQLARPLQMFGQSVDYGLKMERGLAHPIRQNDTVQIRQAYFVRTVTMTRNYAGTMSSRSLRFSPILCITPHPQGQIRPSGSIISSIRGNVAGKLPMVRLGAGLVA